MERIVIATGGRQYAYWNEPKVFGALDRIWPDMVIVGDATGADKIVRDWCKARKVTIQVHYALWNETTPKVAAGPNRNQAMAHEAEMRRGGCENPWRVASAVAVLWFPGNNGTEGMKKIGRRAGFDILDGEYIADLRNPLADPWEGRTLDLPRKNKEWKLWPEIQASMSF